MEYMFLPPSDVNALVDLIRDLASHVPIDLVLKAAAILLARYAHKYIWTVYALDFVADLIRRY